MGQGAKGVSNHLMEAAAGRNMSMTASCQGMQTTKPHCVQLRPKRDKEGSLQGIICEECFGGNVNKNN